MMLTLPLGTSAVRTTRPERMRTGRRSRPRLPSTSTSSCPGTRRRRSSSVRACYHGPASTITDASRSVHAGRHVALHCGHQLARPCAGSVLTGLPPQHGTSSRVCFVLVTHACSRARPITTAAGSSATLRTVKATPAASLLLRTSAT